MYIHLSDIQNGEPVYLSRSLSVPAGGLEVALCELTYYHQWLNIGTALKNNELPGGRTMPDGYYNVCELNEQFEPLGAELHLHTPSGRLQLSTKKRLVLNRGLAKLLGFSRDTFEPGKYTAAEPHRLTVHRRSAYTSPR